jgi:molecular chaperone GrpE
MTEINNESRSNDQKAQGDENSAEVAETKNTKNEPEDVLITEEEKIKTELLETKDRLLRALADFDNYKKIAQRENLNNIKFANEGLLVSLLPILDNLEQAVMTSKQSAVGQENNTILVGVEMVLRQFRETLGKFGIEVFSALDKPFDPLRHEALGEEIDETKEPGTVIKEYQKGYLLQGRLLRPARVILAKKP